MNGITPRARARAVRKVLKVTYDEGRGADFNNVVDCLTDLRHLCLILNLDFFKADRIAKEHAATEQFTKRINTEAVCFSLAKKGTPS